MNLLTIFLTGLLTGGLSCLAVQGGLLATALAQEEQEKLENKFKNANRILPLVLFLVAKLVAYTLLGVLLGLFGSVFQLSQTARVLLQFMVSVFMLGTALNLLNVHPLFRYFVIQPPRSLIRLLRKQANNNNIFTPAVLGAFTIFIPCGVTQSMMALAIAQGNPINGALIMFTFTLGASPLFFILGYLASKLEDVFQHKFLKVAGLLILFLGLVNLNFALNLAGSKWSLSNILNKENSQQTVAKTVTEATIVIEGNRYNPNLITVKRGSQITLNIVNKTGYGCIQAFTIPIFNIQKIIPPGTSQTIKFTAPDKAQEIVFMCSMGMYRGVIKVI